jgi:hypothetical protein
VKEKAMTSWRETISDRRTCRIDLEQVVAVVTTHQQGFVEVYLRGGHVLTVEGTMDDFAPLRLESYSSKNFAG